MTSYGVIRRGKKRIHLVNRDITFLPNEMGGLGIRNQLALNRAFMAKLGWKMCHGKDSLSKDCIFSKYIHANHVTSFKYGSPVWKGIGMGWELLAKNNTWLLGKGESINFWAEDWVGIGPLRRCIEGPFRREKENFRVSDILRDNEWEFHKLSLTVPSEIKERIRAVPHNATDQDHPISNLVNINGFSLGLAYKESLWDIIGKNHQMQTEIQKV